MIAHLEFLTPWPGWVTIAGGAASLLYAGMLYRREGIASAAVRGALLAARLGAIALLAVFLSGPVWVAETSEPGSRSVAVLVDESESMSLADCPSPAPADGALTGRIPRIEAVRAFLAGNAWAKGLPGSPRVSYWGFSDRLRYLGEEGVERAAAAGPATALGDAIQSALSEANGALAAIFLFTDGRANRGADAVAAADVAAERGVRVYAFGVGDPAGTRDVEAVSIDMNDVVLLNDAARVSVRIRSRRFDGRAARVVLSEEGRDVAERELVLADGRVQETRFFHKMTETGRRVLAARVEPLEGEIATANNEVSRAVEVIDAKIKVLLVDGYPRWEFQYLRNALKRDPVASVSVLQEDADALFFPEGTLPVRALPETLPDLAAYDVVVLGDVSAGYATTAFCESLVRFVQDRAGGVVFLAGARNRSPQVFRDTPAEKLLPIHLHDAAEEREAFEGSPGGSREFLWRRGREGIALDVARIDDAEEEGVWERLPGFFWRFPVKRVKPLASVILEGVPPEGEEPFPMLVLQYAGSGRAAFLAADESWRWRAGMDDTRFYRFWGALLRDVSRNRFYGKDRRYRLETGGRREYAVGESIPLRATVLDEAGEPVAWESVEVLCPRGEREPDRIRLERDPATPGGFTGAYTPGEPGTYAFSLMADGVSQAEAVCEVSAPRLELARPDLDEERLQQVAFAGQGAYYRLDDSAARSPQIHAGRTFAVVGRRETPLWNTLPAYLLVVGLLAFEWIVRRLNRAA